VLVDPEILRAFAARAEATAEGVRSARVGDVAVTAADGVPGSTTQWAMMLVGGHIAERADAIAEAVDAMGTAVRGAGDRYEVEDAALAQTFDGLF